MAALTLSSNCFPVSAQAFLLKITLENGREIGFSSYDETIVLEGVFYDPRTSINAFAGKSEVNLAPDNGEVQVLFDGFESLTIGQVSAGILTNSKLEVRLVDPYRLPATFAEATNIISGTAGQVRVNEASYTFEIRSVSELLNRQNTYKTTPKCPYTFGDSNCTLDLRANGHLIDTTATLVENAFGRRVTMNINFGQEFERGLARVLTGANEGLLFTMADYAAPNIVLLEGEIAGAFEVGDTFELTAFDLHDQNACKFFNNFVNFGGTPIGSGFVPGLSLSLIHI